MTDDSTILQWHLRSFHFLVATSIQDAPTIGSVRSAAAYTSNLQCRRSICLSQECTQQGTVWIQVCPPNSVLECLPCSCCSGKTAVDHRSFLVSAIPAEQDNRSIFCFSQKHNRPTNFGSSKKELFSRDYRQEGWLLVARKFCKCLWYCHLRWSYQIDRIWVRVQFCSCFATIRLTNCGAD